jgi:menaquinone-specific isochorismate synthase
VNEDLHARTVPLDYGPDPLQFDGSPTVLFDRPGLTLVGWGTARLVDASDAAKVLAAIPCDDAVQRPGSGVVALGALPFLEAFTGALIVPRFTMGIARDNDGTVQRWATAVGPSDRPLPMTDELFDAVIWQYGTTPSGAVPGPEVSVRRIAPILSSDGYQGLVRAATEAMRAPNPGLMKVVLSRAVRVALSNPILVSEVLRRLRVDEPNCTIFSMPVPDGTFLGASPELLVARHGTRVWGHPLAGTVARGNTARSDADAQAKLAASSKARHEHRYVVEAVAEGLAPYCDTMVVPPSPSLVTFRSVAHLGTRIEGELRGTTSVLELLATLHPTPAVGGTPRAVALDFIAQHEPSPRGRWAGPVGWVGGTGDGEWMIGIRSALLHPDGDDVTLQAGAGIVADSDPEAEAAEVNVKLTTVLEALVPGGSATLA